MLLEVGGDRDREGMNRDDSKASWEESIAEMILPQRICWRFSEAVLLLMRTSILESEDPPFIK